MLSKASPKLKLDYNFDPYVGFAPYTVDASAYHIYRSHVNNGMFLIKATDVDHKTTEDIKAKIREETDWIGINKVIGAKITYAGITEGYTIF